METTNTSSCDKMTVPDRLPCPVTTTKADIWLEEHELQAFRRTRKVRPEYALLPPLCIMAVVMLEHLIGLQSHMILWKVVYATIFAWTLGCMGLPLINGFRAFSRLEKGDPVGALKICDQSTKMVRCLGPMADFYQSFFIDQVRAVSYAMRGQIVEGQVLLAQWVYSPDNIMEDALMQTTFGALYSYAGRADLAEAVYQKRYESSKSRYTSKIGKAIAAANMGWVKFLTAEYGESKKYSAEALTYVGKFNTEDWVYIKVGVWINMSRSCIRLGELKEAESLITQAWELFNQQTKHPGTRAAEINLTFSELRLVQGRFDEALLYINSATECYRATLAPGNSAVVYAHQVKAEILRAMGNVEEAERLHAQAELDEVALCEDNESRLDQLRLRLLSGPNALLMPFSPS